MFVKQGRDLENIPPTATALCQHVMKASSIAVHVQHHSVIACPLLQNIDNNGWKLEKGVFIPNWTVLQEVSVVVSELVKCRCKPEKGSMLVLTSQT